MNDEHISDEAIIAALTSRAEIFRDYTGDGWWICLGGNDFAISFADALAAQRKLDARYAVTDEMIQICLKEAYANILAAEHESPHDHSERQMRRTLKAAMQHAQGA